MPTQKKDISLQESIDKVLYSIIDDWYDRVSSYYVTDENPSENPEHEVELKRFHDEKGHRIKFNKDDLDFTYGLRSEWTGKECVIELSVNNKVKNFGYTEFRRQLFEHYETAGAKPVRRPKGVRGKFRNVFRLESGLQKAFTVERRGGKADIMRLSFRIDGDLASALASNQKAAKALIEDYCVSPFRRIYALVYRSNQGLP